jgi:phospholipid-translocating ATPase
MEQRDEKVAELYEEIEKNLNLLGATGIEDKLQDGVPQCIERLAQAGIKIWVLTGDKIGNEIIYLIKIIDLFIPETAYNIGLSCKLLTNEMEIKTIEENSEESVAAKLDDIRNSMIEKIEELFDVNIDDRDKRLDWKSWGINNLNFDKYRKPYHGEINSNASVKSVRFSVEDPSINDQSIDTEQFEGFAILITGQALTHALSENLKMKFLEIGTMCKAVICCRVTPLQKAQVVELVMKNENKTTLAIGDGANDVSMIQSKNFFIRIEINYLFVIEAHIGIGISGEEGQQAVLASDFSFGQFCYLERLLLIHGRLSYLRVSKFLRYFFYKNFASTFCHFWFAFFCGYSAQVRLILFCMKIFSFLKECL